MRRSGRICALAEDKEMQAGAFAQAEYNVFSEKSLFDGEEGITYVGVSKVRERI